jgi:exoribonuclease-2
LESTGAYKSQAALISKGQAGPQTGQAEEAANSTQAEKTPERIGVSIDKLQAGAKEAMESRGLTVGFSAEAMAEVKALGGPAKIDGPGVKDLRDLPWASIDNVDTKDIDQLAYAEDLGDGRMRLRVAIADVAESVKKDSALDQAAHKNTVTVYTPGKAYAMLPEELSTDWTSLGPDVDRRAIVTDMIIGQDGKVETSEVYEAAVNNKAKLDYASVSKWVEGETEAPPAIGKVKGMDDQVLLQIEAGELLAKGAKKRGALEFEADRVMPFVEDGKVVDLVEEKKNIASEAVAHMMIATNTENAKFLHDKGFPVFQRVVEAPEQWGRMREVAVQAASKLPAGKELPSEVAVLPKDADPAALSNFLSQYKEADPKGYGAVSTSMLKMMGGGDYEVTAPGEKLKDHFGQGVVGGEMGYVHSTAPNRRTPDIIVQRLVKSAVRGEESPYTPAEMQAIADNCNKQESAAKGASRQVQKMAVSEFLTTQVGQQYEAVITGRSEKKGIFVKVGDPPIEGKLLDDGSFQVGDSVHVQLKAVDSKKGHIDFISVPKQAETEIGELIA